MRIAFAVSEVGTYAGAGDYFTAVELGHALSEYRGWEAVFLPHGERWYDLTDVDILVVMRDDYDLREVYCAKPNLVKLAWARNWFERWAQNECINQFDVLLASSKSAAHFLSERISKLVNVMRIATNPSRFDVALHSSKPALDYVFTGSYWQSDRDIARALVNMPSSYQGAIYGKNWEEVPGLSGLHKGFVPYQELANVYAQAAIVIDDANHVTKDWGAANSRVFDALAAGCLVITNSESVSQELFDGALPVYKSPEELPELLARYLKRIEERESLITALRDCVLAKHTYRHRAFELAFLTKTF